jgi:hypothetical protein
MRVQKLALLADQPDKQFHRPDVEQQPKVRPLRGHVLIIRPLLLFATRLL